MAVLRVPGITPMIAVQIETEQFSSGFVAGLTGIYSPDDKPQFDVLCAADENGVVGVIRNAVELAQEGNLTEEILRFSVGLVCGWMARGNYPLVPPLCDQQEQPDASVPVS